MTKGMMVVPPKLGPEKCISLYGIFSLRLFFWWQSFECFDVWRAHDCILGLGRFELRYNWHPPGKESSVWALSFAHGHSVCRQLLVFLNKGHAQEIPSDIRGVVGGVQNSLNGFFELMPFALSWFFLFGPQRCLHVGFHWMLQCWICNDILLLWSIPLKENA